MKLYHIIWIKMFNAHDCSLSQYINTANLKSEKSSKHRSGFIHDDFCLLKFPSPCFPSLYSKVAVQLKIWWHQIMFIKKLVITFFCLFPTAKIFLRLNVRNGNQKSWSKTKWRKYDVMLETKQIEVTYVEETRLQKTYLRERTAQPQTKVFFPCTYCK